MTRLPVVISLALSMGLALWAGPGSVPAQAATPTYSFAVIGDIPYGADQIAAFPGWIRQINADPKVRSVVHLGDIKNGSSLCSDDYFALIRSDFDTFADPLVYTPGDNEWTDCHRTNNGAYNPLERLDKVRQVFFPEHGTTLGRHPMEVDDQRGYPENVVYRRANLTFVTAHVVGSNDDLQPWSGLGYTEATPEQVKEEQDRSAADIANLRKAFAEAEDHGDRAVVVMQQADMFDPGYTPTWNDIGAFKPWVQALVDEASSFVGPVYLFDGDSHTYNVDKPLAPGSSWLTTYGVDGAADNLTRITVDGSSNNTDWLKVTVTRHGAAAPLTWQRVPYE